VVGVIRKLCLVMVVPLALAACSSESTESDSTAGDGSLAVELSGPMGSVENPMTVSGPAVDDGLMCESLVMVQSDFADLDGNPLTLEEIGALHETSADFVWTETYTCDDGSGSFIARGEQLLTAPEIDYEGTTADLARSTIERGTGDYEALSGQWVWTTDFAEGINTMTGAVSND
jgi:hypothetical protein